MAPPGPPSLPRLSRRKSGDGHGPSRDRRILRTLAVAAVIVVWLLATLPPQAGLAAAPKIREVTPAGITIDGFPADWKRRTSTS